MKRFVIILCTMVGVHAVHGQSSTPLPEQSSSPSVANCTDMQEKFKLIKANFNDLVDTYKTIQADGEGEVTEYGSSLDLCGVKAVLKDGPKISKCEFSFDIFSSAGTKEEYAAFFDNTIKILNKVFGDTHDTNSVMTLSEIRSYVMYEKGKTALTSKRTIIVQLGDIFGPFLSIGFEYKK